MAQIAAKKAKKRTTVEKPLVVKTAIELFQKLMDPSSSQSVFGRSAQAFRTNPVIKNLPNGASATIQISDPVPFPDLDSSLNHQTVALEISFSPEKKNKSGHRRSSKKKAIDLRDFVQPLLGECESNHEEPPKPSDDSPKPESCSAEQEAEAIWVRLADKLCCCRKKKILDALQKHNEEQKRKNEALRARVEEYHAHQAMMAEFMHKNGIEVVWTIDRNEHGIQLNYRLEKRSPGELAASEPPDVALMRAIYEEIQKQKHLYQ